MKRSIVSVLIGFFCLAFAAQGFAQGGMGMEGDSGSSSMPASDKNAIEAGASSLSFGVPGGSNPYAAGTFGYWSMQSPTMNLGINVGLSLDKQPNNTNYDILLAPAIKSYLKTSGVITPYYYGQLNFRLTSQGGNSQDPELGLAGGFGVEWFPTQRFSIGGHTGVGIDVLRRGGDPVRIGTFTSGLSAQFYF
jgi:hypothetical protein